MTTIPRFALVCGQLVPSEDGFWVRYEDHERAMLEKERVATAKAVFTRDVEVVADSLRAPVRKRGGIWK